MFDSQHRGTNESDNCITRVRPLGLCKICLVGKWMINIDCYEYWVIDMSSELKAEDLSENNDVPMSCVQLGLKHSGHLACVDTIRSRI